MLRVQVLPGLKAGRGIREEKEHEEDYSFFSREFRGTQESHVAQQG
jgi:hypothetical protein